MPLRADAQRDSGAGRKASLSAEVSYDDGATWRPVPVRHGVAQLRHPGTDGWVSLRTGATDRAGNSVIQTVIRAYEIR